MGVLLGKTGSTGANATIINLPVTGEWMFFRRAHTSLCRSHFKQRLEGQSMQWFIDWDGTMTTKDTLSVVASIGYSKNPHQDLLPWRHFIEAYASDYESHAAKYKPNAKSRVSLEQVFAWQKSLVDVERASIERVERAGVFANVAVAEIDIAAREAMEGERVVLRPGLRALIKRIYEDGCITIVSVNWSTRFIASCLANAPKFQSLEEIGGIKIRANDIESGPSAKLSRTFQEEDRGIWTANDKARVMSRELQAGSGRQDSVYIGDSPSDLPCLLLADVGICIRDANMSSEQRSLQDILRSLDISCHWIGKYSEGSCTEDKPVRHLWWAVDFHEICNSGLLRGSETSLR